MRGIETRRLLHHPHEVGGFGARRMRHELPAAGADVHGAAPRNPVLAVEQVVTKNGERAVGQRPRRAAQNSAPARRFHGQGHSVVAELLLRAVLVKTEIRLNPLGGRHGHLTPDRR